MAVEDSRYQLRWVCPLGVATPTGNDLDDICVMLFSSGLVASCETVNGVNRTSAVEPLPPTTYVIQLSTV